MHLASKPFHFQKFAVHHQNCGQKICSDSLLFGSLMANHITSNCLEIGAGSGVLSLMLSQLGFQKITALEPEPEAFQQALKNIAQSPWPQNICVLQQTFQEFLKSQPPAFDFIISNPPFFSKHLQGLSTQRNLARHNATLPLDILLAGIEALLSPQGTCALLLPKVEFEHFEELLLCSSLSIFKEIQIKGGPQHPAKVSAFWLQKKSAPKREIQEISIYTSPGVYSAEAEAFLKTFLLRFAEKPSAKN